MYINYSFIIPHKNTPDMLRKCIESIPHRDDVQIIIVDDNSDSDIVNFKNFPGMNEKQTEVYLTKEGKGAGYARNVGLQHAVGKWIVFADADDFFNSCIENAMDEFNDSDVDIVFFKATSIFVDSNMEANRHVSLNERIDEARNNNDKIDDLLFFSIPWAKFIKRDFITEHNIRFQEVRWANDVIFSTLCGINIGSYLLSNAKIYCVTDRDDSLRKDMSLECAIVRFEVDCESSRLMKKVGKVKVMSYWTFITWKILYEKNKHEAIKRTPVIISAIGLEFFKFAYHYFGHKLKSIL